MNDGSFDPDRSEPLSLAVRAVDGPGAYDGLRCQRLEFTSRGDRVPGQLCLPDGPGPHPVVLLTHGLTSARNADGMDAIGARWVREGAAVAAIDLPLHGERASAKMTERLIATAQGALSSHIEDPVAAMLWSEFARQAILDLRRTLDALEQIDEVDPGRVAYVGFSLGGILGAAVCGLDPRPRGAAFAVAGAGPPGGPLDPLEAVAAIAPRPVLFVNAEHDETIGRRASERLYAAAADPKSIEWFDCSHRTLPGVAMKQIWQFLRPLLGLGEPDAA